MSCPCSGPPEPGLNGLSQNGHQNSTKKDQQEREKNDSCGGKGIKSARFWVVWGRAALGKGGPGEGRPWVSLERGSGGSPVGLRRV